MDRNFQSKWTREKEVAHQTHLRVALASSPNNSINLQRAFNFFSSLRTDKKRQQIMMMMGKKGEQTRPPMKRNEKWEKKWGKKCERKSIYWYYTKIQFERTRNPFTFQFNRLLRWPAHSLLMLALARSLLLRCKIIVYAKHTAVRQSGKNQNKRIELEWVVKTKLEGEKIDRIYKN